MFFASLKFCLTRNRQPERYFVKVFAVPHGITSETIEDLIPVLQQDHLDELVFQMFDAITTRLQRLSPVDGT